MRLLSRPSQTARATFRRATLLAVVVGVVSASAPLLKLDASAGTRSPAQFKNAGRVTTRNVAHERVLYAFQGGNDGVGPYAPLISDSTGSLYGTTWEGGGSCGCGTVFQLTRSGKKYSEDILTAFNGSDGDQPMAALTFDSTGALYGTTEGGGPNSGTGGVAFKLTPSGSTY